MEPKDIFQVDHTDPISLSIIARRLKAGTTIHFIRRGVPSGRVHSIRKAVSWAKNIDTVWAPGFYTLSYLKEGTSWPYGETLSRGEANTKLKLRQGPDNSTIILELL